MEKIDDKKTDKEKEEKAKNDRFTRALMKYRKDKERKKEEENGYQHKKSNKVSDIAKQLELTLGKKSSQIEEVDNTPIIKESVNFENNNPQNDIVFRKSNKKKKALKKFEDI